MITVTGNDLRDVRGQVAEQVETIVLTVHRRPMGFDRENLALGPFPQQGFIVRVNGDEVPRLFENHRQAADFIAGILAQHDDEAGRVAKVRREGRPY